MHKWSIDNQRVIQKARKRRKPIKSTCPGLFYVFFTIKRRFRINPRSSLTKRRNIFQISGDPVTSGGAAEFGPHDKCDAHSFSKMYSLLLFVSTADTHPSSKSPRRVGAKTTPAHHWQDERHNNRTPITIGWNEKTCVGTRPRNWLLNFIMLRDTY